MARQPSVTDRTLPASGEKPGAAAVAIIVSDRARASVSPSNRSRAMARDSTEAAHTPSAWTTRPAISTSRVVARPAMTVPTTNTERPPSTSFCRP
ncbi:hypothetical protein D3C76_1130530 [compost metagenome]